MDDSREEIGFWSPLPLAECAPIDEAFRTVDTAAIEHQRVHRRLTLAATIGGYGALLIGIWILGFGELYSGIEVTLGVIEVICIFVAGASVAVGLLQKRKDQWLLNRHKAELLRLLKFEFLISPQEWLKGPLASSQWVARRVAAIEVIQGRHALEHAVSTATPEVEPHTGALPPPPTLRTLIEYYGHKRLAPQRQYLTARAQANALWDGPALRNLSTGIFAVSVAAVLTQDFVNWYGPASKFWKVVFTTLGAASLPVVAALIRTLRSAFEFSRNRSRFLAAEHTLSTLEESLMHRLIWNVGGEPSADDAAAMLRDLARCEGHLRNEHQEWLRLMLEAEWFA